MLDSTSLVVRLLLVGPHFALWAATMRTVSIISALIAWRAAAQTVVEVAQGDERFSTLVALLEQAELTDSLAGEGPFSVFAPINEAFVAVPGKFLTPPFAAHLVDVLSYHVLPADVRTGNFEVGLAQDALNGGVLSITSLSPPQVNGVSIIEADVNASNGVIHAVDQVLLPESVTANVLDLAEANPTLSTLVDLILQTGVNGTLSGDGPYTVFAPTDEAFIKLDPDLIARLTDDANLEDLQQVLTSHVLEGIALSQNLAEGAVVTALSGEKISVTSSIPLTLSDNVGVIGTDVLASNGVIHLIDTVLIPDFALKTPVPVANETEAPILVGDNIVTVAQGDARFTTLLDLLRDNDLLVALAAPGPLTVFAPINEAFAAVPSKFLSAPFRAHLVDILKYHVLGAEVRTKDMNISLTIEALNGGFVNVTRADPPQVNGVDIISADLDASNGVIHSVDAVLLPLSTTATVVDLADRTLRLSTFAELIKQAGRDTKLSGTGPFTVFAPTDEAFAKLSTDLMTILTNEANVAQLRRVLNYHILDGIALRRNFAVGSKVRALNGEEIEVTSLSPPTLNDNVAINSTDLLGSNGVIHIIDTVLLPAGVTDESQVPGATPVSTTSSAPPVRICSLITNVLFG